jgi:hypothetical protein
VTRAELERDLLVVVCAISAGIHAALAPEHAREAAAAGLGFAGSAVLLAGLAVVLTRRPATVPAAAGAAAVLLGLIASWGLAVTTGVPVLHPEPEPVEALALATKAIEAAGLLAAVHLLLDQRPATVHLRPTTKGIRT